jgi:hydroxymethylglutaryl-CoA reductase
MTLLSGFSKFDRAQRIDYIVEHSGLTASEGAHLNDYCAPAAYPQQVFSDMIENYIGNFPIPLGVVPHMVINRESYIVPFVTEESSVVAAASKAAKFWATRGGFIARVDSVIKKGQVHFFWNGRPNEIFRLFPEIRQEFFLFTHDLTVKMEQRGGGITDIHLLDKTMELPDYYQIDVSFETADAMGANFINSCLEAIASLLENFQKLNTDGNRVKVIMSILSNYTPDCKVNCKIECPVENLNDWDKRLTGKLFATKFKQTVDIANLDISRAVTHNKGILNGIDAVLLATGNDWRATAAAAHAYASKDGTYKSLTTIKLTDTMFSYELEIPLAVGTVGGITQIHPVAKNAFAMMNFPDARKLMMIAAASGLASNFSAIASLVTTGIQEGHMKMHLTNILNQLHASKTERESVLNRFDGITVSFAAVENFISQIRGNV